MKSLWFIALTIAALQYACKASTPSTTSSADKEDSPAQVTGSMCDRVGGVTGADGTCRCENGVAAFKLLGQTCAQMLSRQSRDCSEAGGQVLYDDGRCRCFPDYDILTAGSRCAAVYPKVSRPQEATMLDDEASPGGACVILDRETGKPQDTCFDQVDLEGCERSYQVAYNQLKPEKYEMVFHPDKSCDAARAAHIKL